MSDSHRDDGQDEGAPVIRDRRRFDPVTGERRTGVVEPTTTGFPPHHAQPTASKGDEQSAGSDAGPTAELEAQLAERTADLQRLQAEYTNYRRRVERDRQVVAETALASVFANLLPVLDDIDRARQHNEVSGGFALVADGLEAILAKIGLESFGDAGEPFDPTVHEALTHGFSADVTEPVCAEVFQSGYRVGERVLRPARVAVLEPETETTSEPEPVDVIDVDIVDE